MGRKRKRELYQQAHVPVQMPRTFDLAERAQLARQLQSMIGEFTTALLTNGEPLTLAVSVQKQSALERQENIVVSVYWKKAEFDVPIFKDVIFPNRCLICGDYLRGDHKCSIPVPNQDQSGEGDQSNETKSSPSPPSNETEPVSTD